MEKHAATHVGALLEYSKEELSFIELWKTFFEYRKGWIAGRVCNLSTQKHGQSIYNSTLLLRKFLVLALTIYPQCLFLSMEGRVG